MTRQEIKELISKELNKKGYFMVEVISVYYGKNNQRQKDIVKLRDWADALIDLAKELNKELIVKSSRGEVVTSRSFGRSSGVRPYLSTIYLLKIW